MFKGTGTALITPFTKKMEIDEEGLRQLVDIQERGGVDAIVPCGTTGESATLTHEEHLKVISVVRDHVSKAKVIAGAGSNATHEAIALSKGAEDLGVDFLLSISPYYNKPTQSGIIKHYQTIAEAVDVPIIVYNVPSRTGCNMLPSTVRQLAEVPNIVGIKEASGDIGQIMRVIASVPKGFSVLSGDDSLTFSMMALGGKGVISVASNIVPSMVSSMVSYAMYGEMKKAREIHYRLLPLFEGMFLETNPIPVKTALRIMGRPSGEFRLPMCDMSPSNLEVLKDLLADLELI